MKSIRKITAFLLVLALVFTGLPGLAFADESGPLGGGDPGGAVTIEDQVAELVNGGGLRNEKGSAPFTDWILAMNAAGLLDTMAVHDKDLYLSSALAVIYSNGEDSGDGWKATGNFGTLAKIGTALTALGVDIRNIPGQEAGEEINLLAGIGLAYNLADDYAPVYTAPYILSLYDLLGEPHGLLTEKEDLVQGILDAEGEWNVYGYDGVGMVMPALALYCETNDDVKTAIDENLLEMSEGLEADGSLKDLSGWGMTSNTLSTVITGLNSLGIDSSSDDRFVTGEGISLLSKLLSYKTEDNKLGAYDGFYSDSLACLQGFQALATWQNLKEGSERSSNLYFFTSNVSIYADWPAPKILGSIGVHSMPSKTEYEINETFDGTGIQIQANYEPKALHEAEIIDYDNGWGGTNFDVVSPDTSSPGTKMVTINYNGQSTTFNITVLAEDGETPTPDKASVSVKNANTTIAQDSAVVIQEEVTSVLDVLIELLNKKKIEYTIKGGYVSEIAGLGEFDKGANAGWLYSVNGITPPTTPAKDYKLKNNDKVVWYYTLDYTQDVSSAPWSNSQSNDGTIKAEVKVTGDKAQALVSKKDIEEGLKKEDAILSIESKLGSITVDSQALASIDQQAKGGEIQFNLEKLDKEKLTDDQAREVGDGLVFDITIISGGEKISQYEGKITISLPFEPINQEELYKIAVYFMDNDGNLVRVSCRYDEKEKRVIFETPHLSLYIVRQDAEWPNPFEDINKGDWFYEAVEYGMAKGLFTGLSNDLFGPKNHLTRAMLVTILHRLESLPDLDQANGKESGAGIGNFSDVQKGSWYEDGLNWAFAKGIVQGYEDGSFRPGKNITRQELATMLYRYQSLSNEQMKAEANLDKYKDLGQVSSFALQAVKWANANGIINGKTDDSLAPFDLATRAEAATMFMRMTGPGQAEDSWAGLELKKKIQEALNDTSAYVLKSVTKPDVGSVFGEWAVLSLARSGYPVADSYYEGYVKRLSDFLIKEDGILHDRKYTEYSRVALALTAIGKDPRDIAGYNLLEALTDFEKTIWQGVNGPAFALLAFDSKGYDLEKALKEKYIDEILTKQLADGGFSLGGDLTGSDPDTTAMVLQALAKYKNEGRVGMAVDKALNQLSKTQNQEGGFFSDELSTSENVSQVIIALGELGISINDPRFVKNENSLLDNLLTYYVKGKGFKHILSMKETDQMATEQALCALASILRNMEGKDSLYNMRGI